MNELIGFLNDILWSYVLIGLLAFAGIYFTVRMRFVQFRMFGHMFRLLGEGTKKSGERGISSFGAFCIGVASRVGTGNLAGVATALAVGGAGAIFWMWIMALLGGASSFVESTLAQLYKQKRGDEYVGGPAYYMQYGLGKRWLGVLFAIIISLTFGLFFNSVQSNTIALALRSTAGYDVRIIGILITIATLVVIFGGVKRIAFISSVLVPIMALSYVGVAIYIVVTNLHQAEYVVGQIFSGAFGARPVAGGLLGGTIMQGVKRGLFSNEAGMGSAPNAAATADVSHPVKQGLIQSLGVFIDTILICSATAFIILVSGVTLDGSVKGIELTQLAMDVQLGEGVGNLFISVAILLFAFSSIIGNYYYAEANIVFITRRKIYLNIYRLVVCGAVFVGSILSLDLVWSLADLFMAFMAVINIAAILLLGRKAYMLLLDYQRQRREGNASPRYVDAEFDVWKGSE